MVHWSDPTRGRMYRMWQKCGTFGEGPTTVANTCAPSVPEWYRTRSPGENILGLKKGHNPLYTAFGERTSQNTHG